MLGALTKWLYGTLAAWLAKAYLPPALGSSLSDFERLCYEVRPGDVILVEGRTRVSRVIKAITQSPWSHSFLYIGRLHDIHDPAVRARVNAWYQGDPGDQLVLEALLNEGTVIHSLEKYRYEHLRLCRPKGLSGRDAQRVIAHAVVHLGLGYDVRQLLDLARFMFPYGILPRRWRSSLFEHNAGTPTRIVCSTLLAEAFAEVQFPILPFIERHPEDGRIKALYRRNSRLFVPRDFDYSPYFEIVKYPVMGLDDVALYRQLPWDRTGLICNGHGDCFVPPEVLSKLPEIVTAQGEPPETALGAIAETPSPQAGSHNVTPTSVLSYRHRLLRVLRRKEQVV